MIDPGPGPLGLCPVRGIVEVEQDSSIWLANTGSQPIQIDKDEVVAMAECFLAEPGARAGNRLRTCWPSGSSKRATVRGAVRPSW